jgi:GxxExxY protein
MTYSTLPPNIEKMASRVIGAAIEVHRGLGPGFLEATYERALAVEFQLQEIQFRRQHPISLFYKDEVVGEGRLDFIMEDCLIVELKSVETLLPIHTSQVLSYLKVTRLPLGLLINFNVVLLKTGVRRVILSE